LIELIKVELRGFLSIRASTLKQPVATRNFWLYKKSSPSAD